MSECWRITSRYTTRFPCRGAAGTSLPRTSDRRPLGRIRFRKASLLLAVACGALKATSPCFGAEAAAPLPLPPLVFFTNAPPTEYTEEGLAKALAAKLAPEELSLAVNPLASTPEMRHWACERTAGATNDLQKARLLYNALARPPRTGPSELLAPATAEQAFVARVQPETYLACQDYAFLYAALARAAGLKAHHVLVEQDCYGTRMLHACAAVLVQGRAVLVDLAYGMFGAPHRTFRLLDDVQSAAVYLSGKQGVASSQIACKLAPELPIVQGGLFWALSSEGRWDEAQSAAEALMRLDPEGPETYRARAVIAAHAGEPELAVSLLREGIALAPETSMLHFALGNICAQQNRWDEACQSYEAALRCAIYKKGADAARQAIADAQAGTCYNLGYTRYFARDFGGAISNCTKAIELRPDFPEAYCLRGTARGAKGDLAGALSDYKKAVELRPELGGRYGGVPALATQRAQTNRSRLIVTIGCFCCAALLVGWKLNTVRTPPNCSVRPGHKSAETAPP